MGDTNVICLVAGASSTREFFPHIVYTATLQLHCSTDSVPYPSWRTFEFREIIRVINEKRDRAKISRWFFFVIPAFNYIYLCVSLKNCSYIFIVIIQNYNYIFIVIILKEIKKNKILQILQQVRLFQYKGYARDRKWKISLKVIRHLDGIRWGRRLVEFILID